MFNFWANEEFFAFVIARAIVRQIAFTLRFSVNAQFWINKNHMQRYSLQKEENCIKFYMRLDFGQKRALKTSTMGRILNWAV